MSSPVIVTGNTPRIVLAPLNPVEIRINTNVIGGGGGTVTSVSVVTANGVSGSVATATTTPAITLTVQDGVADGATKGIVAFTAADFNSASGIISIDYANGQSATAGQKGFLTAADWTTFNNKGSGTVTSVAMTVPNILSVAGSPIVGAGTLAVTLATQAANLVFAGPTAGGAATPTFRALVTADMPSGFGVPGNPDTSVQTNQGGAFVGDANFIWDNTDKQLTVGGTAASDSRLSVDNITGGYGVKVVGQVLGVAQRGFFASMNPADNNLGVGLLAEITGSTPTPSTAPASIGLYSRISGEFWEAAGVLIDAAVGTTMIDRGASPVLGYIGLKVDTTQITSSSMLDRHVLAAKFIGGPVIIQHTSTPDGVALEINSTTGGLVLPRMTTAQRNVLPTQPGLHIFNETVSAEQYYDGFAWRTISIAVGTVTNVTASTPLASSGGVTPNITIQVATAGQNGYLSSADWSTFNAKQAALAITNLTSTDLTVTNGTGAVIGAAPVTLTIANDAVTFAKIQNITDARLLGRSAGSAGDMMEITVGSGLSLAAGALTATGGSMAIGGTVTSGTLGSVLFVGAASVLAQDNANFFWDDTNNRLGIGTVTPSYPIHVAFAVAGGGSHAEAITIQNNTSSAGSNGQAVSLRFALKSTTTAGVDAGAMLAYWVDATHASATSALMFRTVIAGASNADTLSLAYRTTTQATVSLGVQRTNASLSLVPNGTGALIAAIPDGADGGNARGTSAVDLQIDRGGTAAAVASGVYSTISGGFGNKASGTYSAVSGGNLNTAQGNYSFVGGGISCVASGSYSAAFGYQNTASGQSSIAIGDYSLAALYGQHAHAAGRFSATGDAQESTVVARRQTTNNTTTEAFLDGASARIVLANNTSVAFKGHAVARQTNATANASWSFKGLIHRNANAASTVLDYSTVTKDWDDDGTWTLTFSADTVNGSLKPDVKGNTGDNVNWVIEIETVEVTG